LCPPQYEKIPGRGIKRGEKYHQKLTKLTPNRLTEPKLGNAQSVGAFKGLLYILKRWIKKRKRLKRDDSRQGSTADTEQENDKTKKQSPGLELNNYLYYIVCENKIKVNRF
jgi:hypothetical protein